MTSHQVLTLRQEQQAATRQRLLDAAREAFAELGFAPTTVARIVGAANTSRATFYLHFGNKSEALLATWNERELPEVNALFQALDEEGDFSGSVIRVWVENVVKHWEERGRAATTAIQALALEPELSGAWIEGMTRVTEGMANYRRAVGGGEFASALVLTRLIELERVLYFWINGGLPIEREHLLEALTASWRID
ncbi:TetR/AcrR family transcriptional regulator [Arthrobacter sp. YN]|uniref:TetR/AcrR family transcriptional regulator n=1 Tax=Arthrobacter sp. YN TaxID=2020486 RepID=UPI000B60CF3F|nr:TetR/AcrR family transcriptional regulator [Arthrobacter sp. YN]ASN20157.1 hypothetical protein CGK93_11120 [Arthrobacter sp. YN]